MTNYNYEQVIEYYDGTLDENFNNARKWARNHNTTFEELIDRRDLPKRYFQIGPKPVQSTPSVPPPESKPTEDEKKVNMRAIRDMMLQMTDYTQLIDAPFTEEEKASYREYRQYLRDYTEQPNWWEQDPKTYDEWKENE